MIHPLTKFYIWWLHSKPFKKLVWRSTFIIFANHRIENFKRIVKYCHEALANVPRKFARERQETNWPQTFNKELWMWKNSYCNCLVLVTLHMINLHLLIIEHFWNVLKPVGSEERKEKLLGGTETLLAQLNGASLEKNPRIVIARSNISQMLKEAQNNAHAYLYLQ